MEKDRGACPPHLRSGARVHGPPRDPGRIARREGSREIPEAGAASAPAAVHENAETADCAYLNERGSQLIKRRPTPGLKAKTLLEHLERYSGRPRGYVLERVALRAGNVGGVTRGRTKQSIKCKLECV